MEYVKVELRVTGDQTTRLKGYLQFEPAFVDLRKAAITWASTHLSKAFTSGASVSFTTEPGTNAIATEQEWTLHQPSMKGRFGSVQECVLVMNLTPVAKLDLELQSIKGETQQLVLSLAAVDDAARPKKRARTNSQLRSADLGKHLDASMTEYPLPFQRSDKQKERLQAASSDANKLNVVLLNELFFRCVCRQEPFKLNKANVLQAVNTHLLSCPGQPVVPREVDPALLQEATERLHAAKQVPTLC